MKRYDNEAENVSQLQLMVEIVTDQWIISSVSSGKRWCG